MSNMNRYSAAEKLAIISEIGNGRGSLIAIAERHNIGKTTLNEWRHRYEVYGIAGLERTQEKKRYPESLMVSAVEDYLSGKYTASHVIDKYEVSSRSVLRRWVNRYTGHKSLAKCGSEGRIVTKGRSTTWDERIEIVQHCLTNNRDYYKTAAQFEVTYQQVYQWVKKYESGGIERLKDGRGRSKSKEELTDTDIQRLAMKKLEAENERLRAENALLKKFNELERRRF